jgi:hypothetical protein
MSPLLMIDLVRAVHAGRRRVASHRVAHSAAVATGDGSGR